MSAHAPRLSRLFTPTYAARINAQIVYPAQSQLLEPEKLESILAQPLHAAANEPEKPATALAALLSYALIQGRPFLDGNKRTGMQDKRLARMFLTPLIDSVLPRK